ncbi:MAG: hypothetical protein WC758_00115 [Candidatus Woesearchaeota archaeon]|jgi:hypothetical protein
MYDSIRNIPGASHTLKPSLVQSLRANAYNNPRARQGIIEAFFQGNLTETKEYITLVQDAHPIKDKKDIKYLLGFYPGNFTGMQFVWVGSVGVNSRADSNHHLIYDNGRLFGVGAGAPTVQDNKQILSLDELAVLKAYRTNAPLIKTQKGIYIFSDKVQARE